MPFGIGVMEITALLVIGGIVFFFGKNKVKEWLSLGKELKETATTTSSVKA